MGRVFRDGNAALDRLDEEDGAGGAVPCAEEVCDERGEGGEEGGRVGFGVGGGHFDGGC